MFLSLVHNTKEVQRLLIVAFAAAGLVSCSSSSPETGLAPEPSGAKQVDISKDGSNNPFAFSKEDIQRGDDGSITGGRRSQFELKADSAYARANADKAAYLQRSYNKETWSGSRRYSTGSYQTKANANSQRKSWFGGRKSRDAGRVARASGSGYQTGSYRTGSANENGRTRATGSSAYVDEQVEDGWRKIRILDSKEYRSLSLGQARSLLGR